MSSQRIAARLCSFKRETVHHWLSGCTVLAGSEYSDSWDWLKRGTIKKETEGLITAAQDQAVRTNNIKNRMDKEDVSPMCRLCGERQGRTSHPLEAMPEVQPPIQG